ncbi:MAG: phage holin family protein [Firmicutes bacterium]|nr:phage holin family protein [Bacillota bacterium]
MDWLRHDLRFVIAALVLMVVSFLVPGFRGLSFWNALLAALVIAGLGYLIALLLGRNVSPYARGVVGFLVSALVIYLAQFLVPGMSVSILGALLASLVIGVVDAFVPIKIR